jgi:hypothetical protein
MGLDIAHCVAAYTGKDPDRADLAVGLAGHTAERHEYYVHYDIHYLSVDGCCTAEAADGAFFEGRHFLARFLGHFGHHADTAVGAEAVAIAGGSHCEPLSSLTPPVSSLLETARTAMVPSQTGGLWEGRGQSTSNKEK